MINLIAHLLLIVAGSGFGLVGIYFFAQFIDRITTEKLVRGTFLRFHVYFGGVFGIIGMVLSVIAFVLAALTGIFKPF